MLWSGGLIGRTLGAHFRKERSTGAYYSDMTIKAELLDSLRNEMDPETRSKRYLLCCARCRDFKNAMDTSFQELRRTTSSQKSAIS
jgi:hypothetical protein